MQDREIPLCVDLDGTLIRSDLLIESALNLLRHNPLYLLRFAGWLMRGKAHLKREIARRTCVDVSLLPYEPRLLSWLRNEQGQRRRVLCTASDQTLADAVAAHVGGFETVLASDGQRNLAGAHKGENLCAQFGENGFDYAGNAAPDLQVWKHARRAIIVNAPPALEREAQQRFTVERVFARQGSAWRAWIKALRPHQWLKNLLVFLPLLTAHLALVPAALMRSGVAFLCFCLCASGVYVLNDLLDLEADRQHPRKRLRPFAAGNLPLVAGLIAVPVLTIAAFAVGLALSARFTLVLAGYYAMTVGYSFLFKRIAMLDTVVLAGLYTIRIIAGTAAIGIAISFWLLAFSMFLFFSLAMIKRYTELRSLLHAGTTRVARGYAVDDLALIQSLGAASGYLSVLVLALYINSTASEALYHRPQVLWLLCPALLYWISRSWLIAHRGAMHDDPVVFALSDNVSRLILALCALVVIGAI
jgi:4-hydroxybenzoate polyprenyltransferase/phosphoserine phosphatase